MLYSTFSGRPLQSQSEAPLQLQSQSEAPLQQTLTSTSGHGTVPSLDRACNSKAWTITCRESAPGSPGADSSSWAAGFKIKLPFEESIKIESIFLRPRFAAQKSPSMRSGKGPQLPVLVLAACWIQH